MNKRDVPGGELLVSVQQVGREVPPPSGLPAAAWGPRDCFWVKC